MRKALVLDLKKLQARAFDRAGWAEAVLRRYHAASGKLDAAMVQPLRGLYLWMFARPRSGRPMSKWERIKTAFNVKTFADYKGVIRRTMMVERNLRPSFSVNLRRRSDAFQAAFDAFCLRWNLYGMQHDEPLPLKLAVHLTPYGTMIHIPTYWSFDPKRDIRWDAIATLHRTRVPGRQGSALAEGFAERMKLAEKLRELDGEVRRRGLKGEMKHEFLCAGLGLDSRTSPRRISRLRAEFKNRTPAPKAG